MTPKGWERVGVMGVDAGMCWVGDAGYIIHHEEKHADLGKDWHAFCERLGDSDARQFNYDHGSAGLGVCVATGYGDGEYDVYVKRGAENRIAAVCVVFMPAHDLPGGEPEEPEP